MITKRDLILRGSCFCEKYNILTTTLRYTYDVSYSLDLSDNNNNY